METKPKYVLTTGEAADRLGLSESTLNKWRGRTGGPEFLKQGNRLVRYEAATLDAWKASRRRLGTWQYRQPPGRGGRQKPPGTHETPDRRDRNGRPHQTRTEPPKRP